MTTIVNKKTGKHVVADVRPFVVKKTETTEVTEIKQLEEVDVVDKEVIVTTCVEEGIKKVSLNTIPEDEEPIVRSLISFFTTSGYTSEYVNVRETKPSDIYDIKFCDHQYVSLIFTTERKIISLSFKVNIETQEIVFLGERVERKRPDMSDKKIVKKIMKVERSFDKNIPVNAFVQSHGEEVGNMIKREKHVQFSNKIVSSLTTKNNGKVMRYIFETNVEDDSVEMIEECTIKDQKPITTCTKISKGGKTIVETTDIKEIVK